MRHRTLDEIAESTRRLQESGAPLVYPEHAGKPVPVYPLPGTVGRVPLPVAATPCRWGGTDADVVERHPTCPTGARHRRRCAKWKLCTTEPVGSAVMNCRKCKQEGLGYQPEGPEWADDALKYDETNLYPGLKGKRFNSALIEWEGAYVFCWRDGWEGSDLWVCRMDREFFPVGAASRVAVGHCEANYGREDPQLFVFRGKLHVAFVGVVGHRGRVHRTAVLYARLGPNFETETVFAPKPPDTSKDRWEKNWQWFTYADRLYAVYSISPHKIMMVDGEHTQWAYETPFPFAWPGGEMRGGATPLPAGGEFWSFFHDKVPGPKPLYRVGLYTFRSKPPFDVLRVVPRVVLSAEPETNPDNYCDCIFPRGAVRTRGKVILSCGIHDRWTELRRLDLDELERQLVRFREAAVVRPIDMLLPSIARWGELPGWAQQDKMTDMAELVLREKPGVVVEVGVYGGRSFLPMAAAVRANGQGFVYGIDPYTKEATQEGTTADKWWMNEDMDRRHSDLLALVECEGMKDWVEIIREKSENAVHLFADESIDLFHLDGNHAADVSLRDVQLYIPKVKPGGYVWLDDTNWDTLGQAVEFTLRHCDAVKDYGIHRLFRKR